MAGNAHANRQRRNPSKGHDPTDCVYCRMKPKSGPKGKRKKNYRNPVWTSA